MASQKQKKHCQEIAKHIQLLSDEKVCYDDFLEALDETDIYETKLKVAALLSFVNERIGDILEEERIADLKATGQRK